MIRCSGWRKNFLSALLVVLILALGIRARGADPKLDKWIDQETKFATKQLLASISSRDKDSGGRSAAPGSVIASPSTSNPDYFFHWVRDGAVVTSVVITLLEQANSQAEKDQYRSMLKDYAEF